MSKILIGWAEETLVPDKKIALAGQFFLRVSEYVESEITATAMAVEADNEQMIMVSADLPSMPFFLQDLIRENFAKICPKKIILSVTHSHTSHTLTDPNTMDGAAFSANKKLLNEFVPEENHYVDNIDIPDDVMSGTEATVFVAKQIATAAKHLTEHIQTCTAASGRHTTSGSTHATAGAHTAASKTGTATCAHTSTGTEAGSTGSHTASTRAKA